LTTRGRAKTVAEWMRTGTIALCIPQAPDLRVRGYAAVSGVDSRRTMSR